MRSTECHIDISYVFIFVSTKCVHILYKLIRSFHGGLRIPLETPIQGRHP